MQRERAILIMDSGATSHMTPHAHIYHSIPKPHKRKTKNGDYMRQKMLQVNGVGSIRAVTRTGKTVLLTNVKQQHTYSYSIATRV